MMYEFEFFRRTTASPQGATVRRETHDFANLNEAENYGLSNTGSKVDGFRIYIAGVLKKTTIIFSSKRRSTKWHSGGSG
jgi:hypothetical protein